LMVAYIALFLGVRILMGLASMAIGAMVSATGLSLADRGLGGVFCLARGIVIVLAVVILCGMTAIPKQAFWQDALLSPLAEAGARTLKPFLPPALAQYVHF
jgi:membrane protein required for colicin V production